MYRIAIFDDESLIRRNIIKKIDWNKYGFQVVGEGENGREALDVIEETNPDVVFTDIEMPFINGLELSKIMYEDYPLTKIVLITGFDEFKYAQNAIELNVFQYILKPISADKLIEVLEKLKIQLDKEKNEKENIELLRKNYCENLPIIRENFFHSLVSTNESIENIIERSNYVNVNLKANYYICSVINIDKSLIDSEKFKRDDYELIKFAVKNTAKDIIDRHGFGHVFIKDDYVIVIGTLKENRKDKSIERFIRAMEEIKASIQKYMKITIDIGVGAVKQCVSEIKDSYDSATHTLNYRFVVGNNKVIYIEDLEPDQNIEVNFDERKENILINSIKFGSEDDVEKSIEDIFKIVINKKVSFSEFQVYLLQVMSSITRISKTLKQNASELFGTNNNIFMEMLRFDTSRELKEWLKEICLKLRGEITEGRQSTCKVHVMNAKTYIKENYRDSELTLNSLSSHLHISPSYFGAIFKDETGETFSGYLLRVRMDKTKEIMETTNLKNYEIAEMVGYTDQHYFSYSFKKYFRISPNEYKKSIKQR